MTTKKKAQPKKAATDWSTPGSPEGLDETQTLAHGIVTERPDLRPSVERIMVAELDDSGRFNALSLFQTALTTPGDANRDPRVAIAQSQNGRAIGSIA